MIVRVLLVGAGKRGLGTYYPAMAGAHDMAIVAIVEEPSRARSLRRHELGVPIFAELTDAVRSVRPDLAVVATPHDTHVPIGVALLRAGVPTLVEKPLAIKVMELARLHRAATDFDTPLAPLLSMRTSRFGVTLSSILHERRRRRTEFEIDVKVPFYPGSQGWRTDRGRSGGGVLIDLGYHYLDLINSCLGRPSLAHAELGSYYVESCVCEREARISLEYAAAGVHVELHLEAWPDRKSSRRLLVRDEDGRADRWTSMPSGPGSMSPSAMDDPSLVQIRNLLDEGFLTGRGHWRTTLHEQESVLALIELLYRRSTWTCAEAFCDGS